MVRRHARTAGIAFLIVGLLDAGINAQTPSVVPASDKSDWWSMTASQSEENIEPVLHREISDKNYQIAGINLHDMELTAVNEKIGEAHPVQRGDASTWREQACYKSLPSERPAYLIFEHGEVNASFYLFNEATPWNGSGSCKQTEKVSSATATASGLRLGLTPEQVIGILGQPSVRKQNELVYAVEVKKQTAPDALARARQQHPELTEEQFRQDYATYDLTVLIRARFSRAKLVYLGVSITETS
jgi:hypothetical protein